MRCVDLVYAEPFVGERLHDVIKAFKVFIPEEQADLGGDFGLDLAAQPIDAVQVLVGQRHHACTLAALSDDQPLPLEPPQRLTYGNEADSEVGRDLPEGELLPGPQRASQDRSPDLFGDLIDDRRGLDLPHTAVADLRLGHNVLLDGQPDAGLWAGCHPGDPSAVGVPLSLIALDVGWSVCPAPRARAYLQCPRGVWLWPVGMHVRVIRYSEKESAPSAQRGVMPMT